MGDYSIGLAFSHLLTLRDGRCSCGWTTDASGDRMRGLAHLHLASVYLHWKVSSTPPITSPHA